jgi:signal transduction histidine kinase
MVATVTPFILTLCAIANISIGVYVLYRNPRSSTHRAFFLYVIPIGAWAFAVALTHGAPLPERWHVQLSFAAGSLVPIAMLTFAEHFRKGRTDTFIVNRWICALVGVPFCLLAWSPWLVGGVELRGGDIRPSYGPLHGPFATYMLGSLAFGIYVLYRAYRESNGLLRLQAPSGMVHEIRNPLVSIKAFTQLLPTRFDDPEFRQNCARVVGREINRMDDLLDRFRMLSTASRQPMEAVDVPVPLDDTLSLIQPQLEGRGITLRRVTPGPYRPILGNPSQLRATFSQFMLKCARSHGLWRGAHDTGGRPVPR